MNHHFRNSVLACVLALGALQVASANETFCIGSFQDTSYASVFGLARYRIICDDGKSDSVQKGWSYSNSAHKVLFETKALPMADQMGVALISERSNNEYGSRDVFRTKGGEKPGRIAFLERFTSKRRGVVTETLTLRDSGKVTSFPAEVIASADDLSNVDKVTAQEGMARSGAIKPDYSSDAQLFILFR